MRRADEICSQFYQRLRRCMLRIGCVRLQMCGNRGIEYSEKWTDAPPTSDRVEKVHGRYPLQGRNHQVSIETARPKGRHRIQSR